jgi:xylulokinase
VRYELAAHGEASRVESFPDSIDALAILEQQFLSYRFRTAQISAPGTPAASVPPLLAVHAVGGASNNAAIRTVAADALGAPILRAKQAGNACSMGAAYKACWAWTRHSQQRWVPFDTCVREARAQEDYEVVARPEERHAKRYTAALEAWAELEKRAVQEAKA